MTRGQKMRMGKVDVRSDHTMRYVKQRLTTVCNIRHITYSQCKPLYAQV